MDSEGKLNKRIADLEADYDNLKENMRVLRLNLMI